ncbi:uncharacterized protein J4E84_010625 [Alternaria hordeiaustralica]|uniref:uncharacterized protein n=1 Tax=Alternaria hordeiaustralica TaxID=1187925 RepID=UPI0020C2E11B|nr:uncharacterized protein J4E84_010625 [Alternaria hordeiaustralica]KAI4674387.1 hypothetical protein J4E84_010625 [Alternaria hordeiaustralica]
MVSTTRSQGSRGSSGKALTVEELRAQCYETAKKAERLQKIVDEFEVTACPKGHGARRARAKKQLRKAKDQLYRTAVACSRLECPPLLQALQDHLPRELRDMVYAELMDFQNPVSDIRLVGRDMAASVTESRDPYYVDPTIVGKEAALEFLQLRYRRSRFDIHHDALIRKVLDQDAWRQDIQPKRWLSTIHIHLPEDIYQLEERRYLLSQRFELLKELTNTRARIEVFFPDRDRYWYIYNVKSQSMKHVTDPALRQAMIGYAQRIAASNTGTEIYAATHNEDVRLIMDAIFPSLVDLKARGHQIHLNDRISGWTWTAGEDGASFADAWTDRRQYRKSFSLHVIAERLRAEKERFDSTLQELKSWKEKQLSTLEDIEKRLDPKSQSGPPSLADPISKDTATLKLGLAERRINAELRKRSEVEPKELYIHQTLADVLREYAKLVHPSLLDRMFGLLPSGKLPREVRGMVYDHLLPRENTYTIKLATDNTGFSIHKGASDGIIPTPPVGCPYPMISTTHPLADEILERFHWRTTFIIQKYMCAQPLSIHHIIAKLPWWSNIDASVLPENIAGRITFVMRFDNSWRIESDMEETIGDLRKILSSASLGVTVSLSIFPADSKRGVEFLDLAKPLLLELQEKGHEVRMIDLACWTKMHRCKEPPT